MIGLIGAMPVEVEQLMGLLENRKEEKIGMDTFVSGVLFGQEAVLAICGPGKVNAALCAQSMILRYQPEWVLNLGVAGAGEEGVFHVRSSCIFLCVQPFAYSPGLYMTASCMVAAVIRPPCAA